jgi:methylated-DNA-[protein]-cysteine S-methyltransferase
MAEKLDRTMAVAYMESPIGQLRLAADAEGLREVHILGNGEAAEPWTPKTDVLAEAIRQLEEYFQGTRATFDLPLTPEGTDFQRRVWVTLAGIPAGKTISYQELARRLGDPKCIRAAGMANGKNPIAIIIPCHRVIGSDGSLVGYAGGLPAKQWLLDHERKYAGGSVQAQLFASV